MKLVDALPRTPASRTIGDQLVRSGTSVPANYQAACRGRSRAEFIARPGIVAEEADESAFGPELIMEADLIRTGRARDLHQEANEITEIMSASKKTARTATESQIADRKSQIR